MRKSGSSGNEEGESGSVREGVSSRECRFRTWTTRYSSIRDTGTSYVYKHFIQLIIAGEVPAKHTDTGGVFLG